VLVVTVLSLEKVTKYALESPLFGSLT
jgi:hypothetical protein